METGYFERQEGRIAYSDYGGDGELVLMLPGMGALRSEYRFLAPELSEVGYRAVTADLRGHGGSSVPWFDYDIPSTGGDILALIEHLDAGPAHVVGTSFAAGSAVWAAAEAPESVLSLVLISAFVRVPKINPLMEVLYRFMMKNPWRARTWIWYYSMLYPTRKPVDFKEYLGQLRENISNPERFDAVAALGNSSRKPSEDRLGKVKAPTLVIMGMKDLDFPDPAEEGRYIAGKTGGRLELIEGAGHYPQTELPEETAPIILDFLKQI